MATRYVPTSYFRNYNHYDLKRLFSIECHRSRGRLHNSPMVVVIHLPKFWHFQIAVLHANLFSRLVRSKVEFD